MEKSTIALKELRAFKKKYDHNINSIEEIIKKNTSEADRNEEMNNILKEAIYQAEYLLYNIKKLVNNPI